MTFYSFDIWFFVSGFTLAIDLSKNWQKNHSIKFAFMIFLRGFIQIWLISVFILICIKLCFHNFGAGALWDLVIEYIEESCPLTPGYFFLFGNLIPSQC